jgi:hypothetical protein
MSQFPYFWFNEGSIVAVPLGDGHFGYAVQVWQTWLVYPVTTRSGLADIQLLGKSNWRWMVRANGPPKRDDWIFAGIHPDLVFDVYANAEVRQEVLPRWWGYEPPIGRWRESFKVYRGPKQDENGKWYYASEPTEDYRELLLSEFPRRYEKVKSLEGFMKDHLHEMLVLERPFANLLDRYTNVRLNDAMHPSLRDLEKFAILEVWMPPNLPPPKGADSLEDFVDELLSEKDLGGVGEFAEMDTYTFLSCDVTKPDRAAKALLKAFKAAGYTTGIEIKERADNGRVWTLE